MSGSETDPVGGCLSGWSDHLTVPVNRLMTQIVCYLLFIVWIILTLVNPSDTPDKVDGNVYDIMAAVWALGYIFSDMQMMYQVLQDVP